VTFPTVIVREIVVQMMGLKMLAELQKGCPVCPLLQIVRFALPKIAWATSSNNLWNV
jgi:hypothetical protein